MSHPLPATGNVQLAPLVRPVTGSEASPDRPFGYCLGSKSEVSALSVGTYWFPGVVNEITLGPRLASRGSNDHSRNRSAPLLSCVPTSADAAACQVTWFNGSGAAEIPGCLARGCPSAPCGGATRALSPGRPL